MHEKQGIIPPPVYIDTLLLETLSHTGDNLVAHCIYITHHKLLLLHWSTLVCPNINTTERFNLPNKSNFYFTDQ